MKYNFYISEKDAQELGKISCVVKLDKTKSLKANLSFEVDVENFEAKLDKSKLIYAFDKMPAKHADAIKDIKKELGL